MADTKLSALAAGTTPDFIYGIEANVSKRYQGSGVINVKDFGAIGNGTANDTASIQAAFDAAFGPWASPQSLDKIVYFPPGRYKVKSPLATMTVSGTVAEAVTNRVRLTVNTTAGLVNGDMVYVRGVNGTVNANGSYAINNVDLTHMTLVGTVWNAAWTNGGSVRPPCLRIKDVSGAKICGAGKGATSVFTDDTDCAVISALGLYFTHVSDIGWSSDDNGIAFDLNGDGVSHAINSQSSMFTNCLFGGSGSVNGDYCVTIGFGGQMCSEMTFIHCYFATGDIAGIRWANQNALAGTIIGGNFSLGGNPSPGRRAIYIDRGACPIIHGVSFQTFDGIDIDISNAQKDCYSIAGCRTESNNFVRGPSVTDMAINISGCCMTSPAPAASGFFYSGGGRVTITDCMGSTGHYVNGENASVIITNSLFEDPNYLTESPNENFFYLEIRPQRVLTQTGTTYTFLSTDGSAKTIFTNANPITVTVPKNSDNTNRLFTGSKYFVQQGGAGKVTFVGAAGVTIRSRGGLLSLNGQNACGTLTCDGTDAWTLEGDIAV